MVPSDATALPDRHVCEQARLSRDARFDGLFFTAVTSTRIYCRPVCPAPAPRPHNIVYYRHAAAAVVACRVTLDERRLEVGLEVDQRDRVAAVRQRRPSLAGVAADGQGVTAAAKEALELLPDRDVGGDDQDFHGRSLALVQAGGEADQHQ